VGSSNSNSCVVYCIPILADTIDTAGSVKLLLLLTQEECDTWHAAGLCCISTAELSGDKSSSAQHRSKFRTYFMISVNLQSEGEGTCNVKLVLPQ
jgi:hypothetical protein